MCSGLLSKMVTDPIIFIWLRDTMTRDAFRLGGTAREDVLPVFLKDTSGCMGTLCAYGLLESTVTSP